jgi:MFS family permease
LIERLRGDRASMVIQLLVVVLANTAMAGTRPTATYRTLSLGGSAFDVGLIQSAYSILPAVTAVLIGRWVDRFGEVRIYSVALFILGAGSVISGLADALLVLGVGQALIGFGTIAMLIASQAMIANRSRPERWASNYGTYSAFLSLGQLLGPAVAAGVLSSTLGGLDPERAAFYVLAIGPFVGALVILILPNRGAAREPSEAPAQGRFLEVVVRILRRPGMLAAVFVGVVVLSGIDILLAYLPVLGEAKGLPVALVGLLLSVRAGTTLVARLFMDRLLKRLGWVPVLAGSMTIAAVAITIVPLTVTPWLLIVLMAAAGLGIGFGQPMAVTFVASRATKADRATALGVRLAANRVSLLFVPAVMGAVAGSAGVDMIFWVLAAILATGAVVATTARLEASGGEARTGRHEAAAPAGERS